MGLVLWQGSPSAASLFKRNAPFCHMATATTITTMTPTYATRRRHSFLRGGGAQAGRRPRPGVGLLSPTLAKGQRPSAFRRRAHAHTTTTPSPPPQALGGRLHPPHTSHSPLFLHRTTGCCVLLCRPARPAPSRLSRSLLLAFPHGSIPFPQPAQRTHR